MNTTIRFLKLVLPTILLLNSFASAQSEVNIKHFTGENGLPQNSIKFIGQDTGGFLWLGTEDGLVRYDGHNFRVFNNSNLHKRENRTLNIERLSKAYPGNTEGRNERMVVTFMRNSYVRMEQGRVFNDSVASTQNARKVEGLVKDPEEFLKSKGLPEVYVGAVRRQYQSYKIQPDGVDGSFYLCGNRKFSYFKNYRKLFETKFEAANVHNFFSLSGALFYYNQKSASLTLLSKGNIKTLTLSGEILINPEFQSGKPRIKLYWNHISDQVFLVLGKSLYMLHYRSDSTLTTHKLIDSFDLEKQGISRIHYDTKNRKLFLGSSTNGLFEITPRQFRTLTVKGGVSKNAFYAQIPFDSNTILTPDGLKVGLNILTGKVIEKDLTVMKVEHRTDKRGIIRDNNGTIWVKDESRLLQMNSTGTKILNTYKFTTAVKAIHQIKTGAIFAGLDNGEMYQIDLTLQNPVRFIFKFHDKIPFTYLESLKNGTLLAGTNSGMYLVNVSKKTVHLIKETKGLYIKSISPSENGMVWILALEKGMLLMKSQHRVISFPLDKNGYLASPHCVVRDPSGYFWVTTNRGLFQIKEKDLLAYANLKLANKHPNETEDVKIDPELFYIYHAMDEGFQTNEFNGNCQPCATVLPSGYISLPSLNGLVWFKPEDIHTINDENGIVLDQINVNQIPLELKSDTLNLPVDPENIRLDFSTVNSGNIYNQKISYTLVKKSLFEERPNWIPINNEDFNITYSSLGSGNYTLIVRKLNSLGLNNYSYKELYIVIPPRWYETWWARLSFAATASFIVFGLIRYRTRFIQKENRRLEAVIKDRTYSLRQTMTELQQSKNEMTDQLHILSRLMASISHDIQSPLRYITFTSSTIEKMIHVGELDKVAKLGGIISDVSARMSSMLKELLDYIKIQVYSNKMQFKELNLADIVNLKIGIFKNAVENNHSEIHNQLPSNLLVFSEYQLLSIIIHNLIDNAAKYTKNGKIIIDTKKHTNGRTELIISNTGTGLPEQIIVLVNSDRRQQDEDNKVEKISGIGLFIVKEISEMIGVEIKVSQTDRTYFHLYFDRQPAG